MRKDVFVIKEQGEGKKAFWTKIGVAFENKDGSWNVILSALPIDGKLHIRDPQEREQPKPEARPADDVSSDDIPF